MKPSYLIIGNGKLAKHLLHYFSLLGVNSNHYYYKSPVKDLDQKLKTTTHVLVLIKDDAIDSFIREYLLEKCLNKIIIHCSGSLKSKYAYSAHPLMTFGDTLYNLETYKSIPFVCELGAPKFGELIPNLPNEAYYIDGDNKAYYHALISVANNFTTILWQAVKRRTKNELDMDFNLLLPIMQQTFNNMSQDIDNSLTGALKRNDQLTIDKHLTALNGDQLSNLYQEFVNFYTKENQNKLCI